MHKKILIYQILPRLFGNDCSLNKENGSIEENGSGKFSAFTTKALAEIYKMGFTHIWYTGVLEHATKTDYSQYDIRGSHPDVVKGTAGSPYAIRDYYDVSADLADNVTDRMAEFDALIERTHACGLKTIIDFVPNHVAREYFSDARPSKAKDFGTNDHTTTAFAANNNFYYIPGQPLALQFPVTQGEAAYHEYPAKASGNDRFDNHPTINDWYETVKLNYGVDYANNRTGYFTPIPDTWLKMRDILCYWAEKGVDGFRCDMAEMVPVDFWNWVIPEVKTKNKSITFIAEVYQPAEYHNYIYQGHFDYLYDKVGLYDTLRDIVCGRRPASDITACWQNIEGLQQHMLNFLENHDEQRIASDFFAGDPFKAIPAMIVAATLNNNPVMVYAGQELGERGMEKEGFSGMDGRTTIFDYWSVSSLRAWRNGGLFDGGLNEAQTALRQFYIRMLQLCHDDTIAQGKFYDLMYVNYENPQLDPTKHYAFLRCYRNTFSLIVVNFSEKATIHVHIPQAAFAYMDIDPLKLKTAKDLCAGKEYILQPEWEQSFLIELDTYSGQVIKFT